MAVQPLRVRQLRRAGYRDCRRPATGAGNYSGALKKGERLVNVPGDVDLLIALALVLLAALCAALIVK